jgi:uncharacterized cupin superfamily protein
LGTDTGYSGFAADLANQEIYMETEPRSAESIPTPEKKTNYPQPFAAMMEGRTKRKLGDAFGLTNFGVNLTHLAPGAISALYHHHSRQDEFIYVLEGAPTLILGDKEFLLRPGDCMGFKAGTGVAHQLVNRSAHRAAYLELGDRTQGDEVDYPRDDIQASLTPSGAWAFTRKDGTPM